jgi:hypothetical protein
VAEAEASDMHANISRRLYALLIATAVAGGTASAAFAACGCDKPPPPRAAVRPFAGSDDQEITLFDDRLVPGQRYVVSFTGRDGSSDWDRAKAVAKRDFADGEVRPQLRVAVPSIGLGPAAIAVYDANGLVYALGDDQFTVIASPLVLHDFAETITRDGYQTGVSADGTLFVAIDTSAVTDATTYSGVAEGYPLRFASQNVAIFNAQGFLMGLLDPRNPGLFQLDAGGNTVSTGLEYWRHEFRTYKDEHRKRDERRTADGEWHADGTAHVDNYHMMVAISGVLSNGQAPTPGATPPFRLIVTSTPAPTSSLP